MLKIEPWLEITTVSKCIIDCTFCPQHIFQECYHGCSTLSLYDFKKALSTVPKTVAIHFSGFAEPFLNPQCLDMIEHAHLEGYRIVLFSTLVGLKSIDVKRLRDCHPQLILHLPDHLGNAKIPITKAYKDTLITVLKSLHVNTFYVMDEYFISNERAGLCRNATKRHVRGWLCCEKLFTPQFVMLPNCDVVLCCMDYGLKHLLGSLLQQSWLDIVKSPEYRKVCANRFKMGGNVMCRKCAWASPTFRCTYYAKRLVQRYYAKRCLQQSCT